MQHLDLGTARIRPSRPIAAGSVATVTYTYTAGHPIDDSGYLLIAFRQMGDFGEPQFEQPDQPDYCSVSTSGDCRIIPRWDRKGHTRPWTKALYLQVRQGYLDRGQTITVVFGDRRAGSPGWRTQTFCESTFEFKTLVDPIATYQFKELPRSPTLRIVAGQPARAVCIAPSQALVGRRFQYHLKLEDRWGNPTRRPRRLTHPGFPTPGVRTLKAKDAKTGLTARSNPIDVVGKTPPLSLYWADFHGQSEETIGSNSIDDYFAFARDRALLDMCGHQGNDFQVTDEFWKTINACSRSYYEPGRFVTFPGYEWSGNTPLGGDRNVYFESEGGRIVHSSTDLLPGKRSRHGTAPTAAKLFCSLRRQTRPRAFAFAHVGGRYADLAMHDPRVEIGVEVHSAWGTFEWLVDDALQRGCRVGICANSDGHKSRPGASYPGASSFGSLGGLTCVMCPRLDRRSVVAALRARHCFATTGHRPLLDVRIGRAMMGDVIEPAVGQPVLSVRAVGTGAIQDIQVRNGPEVLKVQRPAGGSGSGRRIKVVWSGAEVRGRARMAAWDGRLAVRGNRITDVQPINFWNPDRPVERVGSSGLRWQCNTTGGLAGVILRLARPGLGTLEVKTVQRSLKCAVSKLRRTPRTWSCGGLRKEISICRLPDRAGPAELAFDLPLTRLRRGDNPVYVRVQQEDGHLAWSSPIYLVRD